MQITVSIDATNLNMRAPEMNQIISIKHISNKKD